MKKTLLLLSGMLLFPGIAFCQIGIKTTTPQKTLHVNGSMQLTNELNLGGTATTAGTAGTAGQLLISNGAGAAPAWSDIESSGIAKIAALGLKPNIGASNFAANSERTIIFSTTPKIDTGLVTYNSSNGTFTIKKTGYYQFILSSSLNMDLNPSGQTAGTAQTFIIKGDQNFAQSSSGHGERTTNVYHTTAGLIFCDIGDIVKCSMNMTRNYRIGKASLAITYFGN